ncbi:hypothetical protein B0A48_12154 [Cryoendolithus antarcticus]|uniref:F-box domain-containing protein n=1 Tax=Cryoendolithus antarcticus TaxID=1507870 RepID=A0A1V8STZ7_9PEZI|nr:hypothetical protein B0A48_12154 [Cryoendolithus antarcticus]
MEIKSASIFVLPNEILLSIFSQFSTHELLQWTSTCRRFHSLILRLFHNRLQYAAELDGHTMYLECYHPSDQLTAPGLFGIPLGTHGLDEIGRSLNVDGPTPGQARRLGNLYTRFRPQQHEPERKVPRWLRPGDVPGSRTHPASDPQAEASDAKEVVRDIVTVDAHELFSQLATTAYLGKREPRRGLLESIVPVTDSTIRVWRDWLKRMCESRSFSDESTIVIHRELQATSAAISGTGAAEYLDPSKDPNVLWANTRHNDVGIKFKVVKRKQRAATMPLMYASDVEVPVSYEVEFEEVYVRTGHLVLSLEQHAQKNHNSSGKAVIFGAWSGSPPTGD